jgi:hypothetical protein
VLSVHWFFAVVVVVVAAPVSPLFLSLFPVLFLQLLLLGKHGTRLRIKTEWIL